MADSTHFRIGFIIRCGLKHSWVCGWVFYFFRDEILLNNLLGTFLIFERYSSILIILYKKSYTTQKMLPRLLSKSWSGERAIPPQHVSLAWQPGLLLSMMQANMRMRLLQ